MNDTENTLRLVGVYSLMLDSKGTFVRKVIHEAGTKANGLTRRWDEVQDTGYILNGEETAELVAIYEPSELESLLEDIYDDWTTHAETCDECGYLTDDSWIRSHGTYCSASCAGTEI